MSASSMKCGRCCGAPVHDPATASNTAAFDIPHFDLHVATHFDSRRLFGRCDLTVKRRDAAATELTLDVHHLDVAVVQAAPTKDAAEWTTLAFDTAAFTAFGSVLKIATTPAVFDAEGATFVRIHYSTRPSSPALSWLEPAQTAGKEHRFLFTQGQACLNRSFFPCQDTPSVRSTWSATVVVPAAFTAVMSGHMTNTVTGGKGVGTPVAPGSPTAAALYPPAGVPLPAGLDAGAAFPALDLPTMHAFASAMPHTVPVYLVALAVGDLRAADIGPRSRVWSEPALIDRAAWEFGDGNVTERYLAAGEEMFGPYRWGRYDIIVMPPSFPFGGMENPCATFVTPALLAGDHSLCDVIAHEIAHSWTGNLVTNASFETFSINEGFTMYLQRRITSVVHGPAPTALEHVTGRQLLADTIRDYGAESPLMRLVVPLEHGTDPDETYTDVPYEKGCALVAYLRQCVGSDAAFDSWIKAYTSGYAFESIGYTEVFASFFDAFPHLKGDWSPERWDAEEAAEKTTWWDQATPAPADLASSGTLPPLPAPASTTTASSAGGGTVGDAIVDDKGRRGLAYRPGYEFMRWLHAPGWPVYMPALAEAGELSAPAEALAVAWKAAAAAAGDSAHRAVVVEGLAADATADAVAAAVAAAIPAQLVPVAPHLSTDAAAASAAFPSWPTLQKLHFLDTLVAAAWEGDAGNPVGRSLVAELDRVFGLSASGNAEVRLRWSQLSAITGYAPGYASIAAFFTIASKLKYVTPVFRALLGARPVAYTRSAAAAADAASGSGSVPLSPRFATQLYRVDNLRETLHPAVQSRVDGVFAKAGAA